MSTVFRGTPEAEAARRDVERELADSRPGPVAPVRLAASQVKELCLELGADDTGFVEVDRAALGAQRDAAEGLLHGARTLVSLVIATDRDNLTSLPRSIANGLQHVFDGTRANLDGISFLVVIEDDPATQELLLAVQNSSLRVLEPDAAHHEPTATARGRLSAWMDLLVHAAAGNPTGHDDLAVSGNTAAFDTLVQALH